MQLPEFIFLTLSQFKIITKNAIFLCVWCRLDRPSLRSNCLWLIPQIHPVAHRWLPPHLLHLGLYILQFTAPLKSNRTGNKPRWIQTASCSVSCENPVTFCCLLLSDHILCSVTWPTDERVAVQWLTRKQNYVVVQIYDFDGSSWREKQVALTALVSCPVRKSWVASWRMYWLHGHVSKC